MANEQLAATVACPRSIDREELSIPLRRETRAKLARLARAEGQATARPVTGSIAAADPGRPSGFVRFHVSAGGLAG